MPHSKSDIEDQLAKWKYWCLVVLNFFIFGNIFLRHQAVQLEKNWSRNQECRKMFFGKKQRNTSGCNKMHLKTIGELYTHGIRCPTWCVNMEKTPQRLKYRASFFGMFNFRLSPSKSSQYSWMVWERFNVTMPITPLPFNIEDRYFGARNSGTPNDQVTRYTEVLRGIQVEELTIQVGGSCT